MKKLSFRAAIQRMALQADPEYCRLGELSKKMQVHESTVHKWLREGRMPRIRARDAVRIFGDKIADIEVLSGSEL
jgi:hypothetical protein